MAERGFVSVKRGDGKKENSARECTSTPGSAKSSCCVYDSMTSREGGVVGVEGVVEVEGLQPCRVVEEVVSRKR